MNSHEFRLTEQQILTELAVAAKRELEAAMRLLKAQKEHDAAIEHLRAAMRFSMDHPPEDPEGSAK